MSAPVVQKYLACAEFDATTGACSFEIWVDAPGILPAFTPAQAVIFAGLVVGLWLAVFVALLPQHAARDE